jgi:hypothetical protein
MVNAFLFPVGNQMTSNILSFLVIYLSYTVDIRLKYVILKVEKLLETFPSSLNFFNTIDQMHLHQGIK